MTKKKKLILAFTLINFLILMGSAVFMFSVSALSAPPPPPPQGKPGFLSGLDLRPLGFMLAGFLLIFAIVELILGLLAFNGKKWAAIVIIICTVFVTWVGIFGAIAAALTLSDKNETVEQTQ